jgi:hypothetical protein
MKRPVDFKNNNKASMDRRRECNIDRALEPRAGDAVTLLKELGKTKSSVANYLSRNRQWLGLEKRSRHYKPARQAH